MPYGYVPRYPGPRWQVVYGAYAGVEQFALEELQRLLQAFVPYVVEVHAAAEFADIGNQDHVIFLGTPLSNPRLAELLRSRGLVLPDDPQGYTISSFAAPWNPDRRAVILAGQSPVGALYAVETFNAQVLCGLGMPEKLSPDTAQRALERIEDFTLTSTPRVAERGIWTWGYVIYDYRRFLDQMARLRLNTLTIWNDRPPLNGREIIQYAHARGIRVVLGFAWGWGQDYDLANPADRQRITEDVVQRYCAEVLPLAPDGIYFQTLTEHSNTELGGRSVASLTCELVNHTAARLFEVSPDLQIQFGLHATSIREHYADLAALDPRVTITWEDAGALPFAYNTALEIGGVNFEQTMAYARELAAFRPMTPFAMVPKGWTTLDWPEEFEHHGPFLLGERSPAYIRRRLELHSPRWEKVNALWMSHYPKALEFYRALAVQTGGRMLLTALIEDGQLEERIQPSVALFAESAWDPFVEDPLVLQHALSAYYQDIW